MKCYQIFALVIVALIFDQANSLFLPASGNVSFSGNFHGLLANHPWLTTPKEETTEEQLPSTEASTTTSTTTTTTTTSTTTEAPIAYYMNNNNNEAASMSGSGSGTISGQASGSIDFNQIIGGAINRHVMRLQHVQKGLSSRIDSHIQRLERFDNHIQNHFNKASASGSRRGSISIRGDFDFGVGEEGDSVSTF